MQLMGNRSLAWALKWITDAAIVAWSVLIVVVLVVLAIERAPGGSKTQQGTVSIELKLPTEILEPSADVVEVLNFEATGARIHYRTEEIDVLEMVGAFATTIILFPIMLWILWEVRQVLASLVAHEPLSFANARRFRTIGLLMVFQVAAGPLWRALDYLRLQTLFQLLPQRGFFELYVEVFSVRNLFAALLMVLMAEVLRLAVEHRVDSEAVI